MLAVAVAGSRVECRDGTRMSGGTNTYGQQRPAILTVPASQASVSLPDLTWLTVFGWVCETAHNNIAVSLFNESNERTNERTNSFNCTLLSHISQLPLWAISSTHPRRGQLYRSSFTAANKHRSSPRLLLSLSSSVSGWQPPVVSSTVAA